MALLKHAAQTHENASACRRLEEAPIAVIDDYRTRITFVEQIVDTAKQIHFCRLQTKLIARTRIKNGIPRGSIAVDIVNIGFALNARCWLPIR